MYLSATTKSQISEFLNNNMKLNLIYIFGSFAKGEGREDSDIDIAIYTLEQVDSYELFVMANELGFIVKRDIQIINLSEASTVFKAQIVGTGEVIYCTDENLRAEFEVRSLKDYVKLNEERQVILDSIKKDGKVYGK
ncbi:MAG: nucleotidyltransferase domain-containing protein [Clostridium sp.]